MHQNSDKFSHKPRSGDVCRSGVLRACVGASLGAVIAGISVPAQAEIEFHPKIKVGTTWTDNIELATDSQSEETEYVAEVVPGFTLEQDGRRFRSSLDYVFRNFFYAKDSDRDSTFHQAEGSANADIIQQWLFVDASGSYAQQVIDPTRPVNNSFLFDVGNLTDAVTAQISPYVLHEFDEVVLEARYTRGILDYKQSLVGLSTSDAETEGRSISLASPDDNRALSWALDYSYQSADYEQSSKFEFERANAEIGIKIASPLRLIARVGQESDPRENLSDGGLDETTWEAGFAYRPDTRTELQAFYGERFFGRSIRASARREAQFLVLAASYQEGPVTQAQQLLTQPPVLQPIPQTPFDPGTDQFGTLTNEVFLSEDLDASVAINGRRTRMSFGVLEQKRTYFSNNQTERLRGGQATLARTLNSRIEIAFDYFYRDNKFRTGEEFDEDTYRLNLSRKLSERIDTGLMLGRLERSGVNGYVAHWATLNFTASF